MALSSISPYVLLGFGILAEIIATTSLKLTDGFDRPVYLIPVVAGYGISFAMLALVLKTEDVGPVYAIWAGSGVAGVAIIGYFLFNEGIGLREMIGFASIILGVVLLSR